MCTPSPPPHPQRKKAAMRHRGAGFQWGGIAQLRSSRHPLSPGPREGVPGQARNQGLALSPRRRERWGLEGRDRQALHPEVISPSPPAASGERYHRPHFADERAEAHSHQVPRLRSQLLGANWDVCLVPPTLPSLTCSGSFYNSERFYFYFLFFNYKKGRNRRVCIKTNFISCVVQGEVYLLPNSKKAPVY